MTCLSNALRGSLYKTTLAVFSFNVCRSTGVSGNVLHSDHTFYRCIHSLPKRHIGEDGERKHLGPFDRACDLEHLKGLRGDLLIFTAPTPGM